MKKLISNIYDILLNYYGYQGWWPLLSISENKTRNNGDKRGYHPGDYSLPKDDNQVYEICIGAILTQNTSWLQVEKALNNLFERDLINPDGIIELSNEELSELIKPSGYFNQKAKKIRIFTEFFLNLKGRIPLRKELLSLWGIGRETADSILLYAYKKPYFVIDAYTKRIFNRVLPDNFNDYDEMRSLFEESFKNHSDHEKVNIFNEYHALIVEHGKNICKKKPLCKNCVLKELCEFYS